GGAVGVPDAEGQVVTAHRQGGGGVGEGAVRVERGRGQHAIHGGGGGQRQRLQRVHRRGHAHGHRARGTLEGQQEEVVQQLQRHLTGGWGGVAHGAGTRATVGVDPGVGVGPLRVGGRRAAEGQQEEGE